MVRPEHFLTLSHAFAVVPTARQSVGQWRQATTASLAGDGAYRLLMDRLLNEVGITLADQCDAARSHDERQFADAQNQTCRTLAHAALSGLTASLPADDVSSRCRLLLHSSASLDEYFHQSAAGWLASVSGMSHLPHCSISQLQGASFAGVVDIIDAMLQEPGAAAIHIAGERWPSPAPRVWPHAAIMADGAAALWFVRGVSMGLQLVDVLSRTFPTFLLPEASTQRVDVDALVAAAAEVIAELGERNPDMQQGIDVWLPSGLDTAIDEAVRSACTFIIRSHGPDPVDHGYLCTAATPVACTRVLEQIRLGQFAAGSLVLGWGASFAGGVGTSLWRVVTSANKDP